MTEVGLLASVALASDVPEQGLTRGEVGTVVEFLRQNGEETLLVEFSDEEGQTYAMAALKADQLIVLHRRRNEAA